MASTMSDHPPPVVVVMGVAGSGKTAVGRELATGLGVPFADADDLHPETNVAKMRAGTPLDDADRRPWLDAVAAALALAMDTNAGVVLACSALKRRYRDRLRLACPALRLVHLAGPLDVIRTRLAARAGHFMPPALLGSQLADLEPPTPDERPVVADVTGSPGEIAARIIAVLHERPAAGG